MFKRHGKKPIGTNIKSIKDLNAIVSPLEFLKDVKRRDLINKIEANAALSPDIFKSMVSSLINNLVNYCQNMPETTNSYYALPGGLVDHALNRTEAALDLFRKHVVQDEASDLSNDQKLWLYALLTAGILQGIGKLQIDYRVELFDSNGTFLKSWAPLLESMTSFASYYRFLFLPEGDADLRRRLNILLARALMPTEGFAWIISNPEVLTVWLALLSEDSRGAGTLGAILVRADAIAISRYFNEMLVRSLATRGGRQGRISTFVDTNPDSLAEKERLIGVEFINWLTEKLASGEIFLNKAPLLYVPGGLLMSVESFKWFVREHPEYKNWQAAQAAFLSLGLHSIGADGSAISRFEESKTHEMHSGIVFSEYAIALPENVQVHNTQTGKVSSMSSMEFLYQAQINRQEFNRIDQKQSSKAMQSLSSKGEWQAAEEKSKTLQSGKTRGG